MDLTETCSQVNRPLVHLNLFFNRGSATTTPCSLEFISRIYQSFSYVFFHNKSANGTFSPDFSANGAGLPAAGVSPWLRRTYQTGHIHAGIGIIKNKVSVAPFYHALHIIIVISLDVRLGVLEQSERNPSPSQSVSEQSERNPSPFQMGVVSCRSSREENVLCWTQAR
jgi:hypothetical protein